MELDPKHVITRDEALALAPTLVAHLESKSDSALWEANHEREISVKRGQTVIVARKTYSSRPDAIRNRDFTVAYILTEVTQVVHNSIMNEDGPVVRVRAGDISWRVDGNESYCPVVVGA